MIIKRTSKTEKLRMCLILIDHFINDERSLLILKHYGMINQDSSIENDFRFQIF